MKNKKLLKSMLTFMVLLCLFSLNLRINSNKEEFSESNDDQLKKTMPSSSIETIYNETITINGNTELENFPNKTGSGTMNDPYIIENISLNLPGRCFGFFLFNISKYLTIRNCTIINITCAESYNEKAIEIRNCSNIIVSNCTFIENENGIWIYASKNITILNNTFYSQFDTAIELNGYIFLNQDRINGEIKDCLIANNTIISSSVGIYIGDSWGGENWVANNTILGNYIELCEIGLDISADDNLVFNNYIELCEIGIALFADYNLISYNTVKDCTWGLDCASADYNSIENNQIIFNRENGITFNGCYSNEIIGNNISRNSGWGIYLRLEAQVPMLFINPSNNNRINGNYLYFNQEGCIYYGGSGNVVENNFIPSENCITYTAPPNFILPILITTTAIVITTTLCIIVKRRKKIQ